jgi:multicomponent Na+:H+ antiporter subunit E
MSSRQDLTGTPFTQRGVLTLWAVLFAVWMMANASLAGVVALTGAQVTLALAAIFTAKGDAWKQVRWSPQGAYHFLAYTGTFVAELVSANLNMLGHVYAPRMNIRPGIVRVRTRLKSPIGRLALANSIALTPGSLVLETRDDIVFLHWLDVQSTDLEDTTEMIVAPFEKHLERVFG